MQIIWQIHKKRGYVRPTLTYTVNLEEHEKALCLPALRIDSSILEPVDSWQEHCWPGQYERADPPVYGKPYAIDIPSHQGRSYEQSLRLAWREDNNYPEVEETFAKVRAIFEDELSKAYNSKPIDLERTLQASVQVKRKIAPALLADRFLKLAQHVSEAS